MKFTSESYSPSNDINCLSQYHYFEKYDKYKDYALVEYKMDYGHGTLTYKNYFYSANGDEYVYALEILSEEEQKKLSKYCQCSFHKKYWFNPSKLITNPIYMGCLHTPSNFRTSQKVIDDTRNYINSVDTGKFS